MTEKEIIVDGELIKCPCYINKPLYRYHKGCLMQSQAFKEQQTEEKPILKCCEIENCPVKEQYKQLQRKTAECEKKRKTLKEIEIFTLMFCKDCKEHNYHFCPSCDRYKLLDIINKAKDGK